MKYSFILLALILVFFLWQFIAVVVEQGWPTQSVYYIASLIEIGLGYLTVKYGQRTPTQRRRLLLLLIFTLCIGIPIVCYHSGIEFLRPISGAQLWYIVSSLGFTGFTYIKKRLSEGELTEAEKTSEYMSKGLIWVIIIMAIILIPAFLLIYYLATR